MEDKVKFGDFRITTNIDDFEFIGRSKSSGEELRLETIPKQTDAKDPIARLDIEDIKSKLPNDATESNKLVTKDFVNSSIQNIAANRVTKDPDGKPFTSHAELMGATIFYFQGEQYIPTKNDYTNVSEDEAAPDSKYINGQTRYRFDGINWIYELGINERPFTAAENAVLASGVTADIINQLMPIPGRIVNKQDQLVSGINVKTINGRSILGAGNIVIEGGEGGDPGITYYPLNLIPFNDIIVGEKILRIQVDNGTKTTRPDVESNPNYAWVKIDLRTAGISNGKATIQGIKQTAENRLEIFRPSIAANGNLYGPVNPETPYGGTAGADVFNTFKTGFEFQAGSTAIEWYINIPIGSLEMLKSIDPSTSELTVYSGWETKEFDYNFERAIIDTTTRRRTRNLANPKHLLQLDSTNAFGIGYMDVKPNTEYLIYNLPTAPGNSTGQVVLYDVNWTAVQTINLNTISRAIEVNAATGKYGGFVTTAANAKYMVVRAIRANNQTELDWFKNGGSILVQESKYGFEYAEYWEPINTQSEKVLESWRNETHSDVRSVTPLNIACLGDSVTAAGWQSNLSKHLTVASLTSRATSGTAWTSTTTVSDAQSLLDAFNTGTFNNGVKDVFGNTVSQPDYLIIFLSLNVPTSLGDPNEVMAKDITALNPATSQSEAIRYFLNKFRETWPDTKIILLSRYQAPGYSNLSDKGKSVSDNVVEMAARMSVPCFDLFSELGIDPIFEPGKFMSDNIHINQAGQLLLAKYVANKIKLMEL